MTRKPRTKAMVAAFIVIMALGLSIRLLSINRVITDNGVRLLGNDAYYHALRTERSLANYPVVPSFDPLINHPEGADIPWPPLFDFLAASAARLTGIEAGTRSFELLVAWVPALIGVLSLGLFYPLIVLISGRSVALRATFLLAVLPASVTFSEFGRFDQHVLEVLFLGLSILIALSWTCRKTVDRQWLWTGSLGLMIALSFLNWNGSALLLGVLGLIVGLSFLMGHHEQDDVRLPELAWKAGSIAALILLIAILLGFSSHSPLTARMSGLNVFHITCVVIFTTCAWVLDRVPGGFLRERLAGRATWALVAVAVPVLLSLFLPGFKAALGVGAEALTTGGAWLRNILEYDPLLFTGHKPWQIELGDAVGMFGTGLLLLPIAVAYIMIQVRRGKAKPLLSTGLLIWGMVFLLLTLSSRRFSAYLVVPLAIWLACLWDRVEGSIRLRMTRLPRLLMTAVIAAFLLWPCVGIHLFAASLGPDARLEEVIDASRWLSRQEVESPRDAVLAEWHYGHHLSYYARKPVVVTPFGTHLGLSAMQDCADFFQADTSEGSVPILQRREVRYVLLENPVTEVYFSHSLALNPGQASILADFDITSGRNVQVTDRFWDLVVSRLYFFDGSSRLGAAPSLDRFRLLYESNTTQNFCGMESKTFKVFEFVTGARLVIAGPPLSDVRIGVVVTTNARRRFEWKQSCLIDSTGRAEIRLPYATGINGAITADQYVIQSGGDERHLSATKTDVRGGATLRVSFQNE